jgi:hypothetical protein
MRSMVEGGRSVALPPLHRTPCGPPPRSGEDCPRAASFPLLHPHQQHSFAHLRAFSRLQLGDNAIEWGD